MFKNRTVIGTIMSNKLQDYWQINLAWGNLKTQVIDNIYIGETLIMLVPNNLKLYLFYYSKIITIESSW